jgi:hypothetical protein
MGTLNSIPSMSIQFGAINKGGIPTIYVFWQGYPSFDLTMAYYNGKWHRPMNLGMKMYSQPEAPDVWFGTKGQPEGVAWVGARNQLTYATSEDPTSKKSWKGPYNDHMTVNAWLSVADGGGGAEVAYWDGGGHLYAASFPFDQPEGKTGSKFGPCEFKSMGLLASAPSAVWFQGVQVDGAKGRAGRQNPSASGRGADASPTSGNCPVMYTTGNTSFGNSGFWIVCWDGHDKSNSNIYCMQWVQMDEPGKTILGPYREGSFGVLGSSPEVIQWPGDNLYTDNTSAFWQSSNGKQDLMWANIIPASRKATNLGYGPLSGGA